MLSEFSVESVPKEKDPRYQAEMARARAYAARVNAAHDAVKAENDRQLAEADAQARAAPEEARRLHESAIARGLALERRLAAEERERVKKMGW